MSQTARTHVEDTLSPYVETFEEAARNADDLADVDVFEALAAIGRGEDVPADVATRIVERGRKQ